MIRRISQLVSGSRYLMARLTLDCSRPENDMIYLDSGQLNKEKALTSPDST